MRIAYSSLGGHMIKYTIGEVIRRERKSQKISQEELADGICTPSWLSKIESGACIPTIAMFESLMKKLGKSSSQFIQYKSEIEMEIERLKYMTRRYYRIKDTKSATETFEKLQELSKEDNSFDKQFIMLYKIVLENNDMTLDERKTYLETALSYSIPDFKISNLDKYLLKQDEIIILNCLIHVMIDQGKESEAINNYKKIKTYLENPRFDYEEKTRTYPIILSNLAQLQGKSCDYLGCLSTCENAITFCIQYDSLSTLPNFLYFKGRSLAELGSSQLAEKTLRQAFSLFEVMNETINSEKVRQYTLKKLSIDIAL